MTKPCLAVTLGDPSGIGPETVARAILRRDVAACARIILVGDPAFLPRGHKSVPAGVEILKIPAARGIVFGSPSRSAGFAAIESLEAASRLALSGAVDGIVTAPASKISLNLAASRHRGHTELLRVFTRSHQVEMMMVAGSLRALLLTRHVPLMSVARNLSQSKIISAARLYFSIFGRASRMSVCALNPHAGDGGIIGSEEKKLIAPVVRRLASDGFKVKGPLGADTAFELASSGEFDVVLAMYHDQAMIPLKVLSPRAVVNVTLGLPFIRTAPGHGTAYDIAGKGIADARPTAEAIKFAASHCGLFRRPR
ncbi:MAG: 4-hydroxythreonine-4-phosphate dehydrogenase PdxA [Endomicrobiia bacterium]|nr:4-hydroxythreonine-4-phosphate dehydrogenase PdxA [Endomicrobiia bacterium]